MKKSNYALLLAIFSLSFFTNCGSDDSSSTESQSGTLEQEREATAAILTSSNNGVWRISEANLANRSGIFNISNNFNVVDDEFIFSGTAQEGMLQWRQGNAVNIEATSAEGTLLDYYKAPENSSFSFIGETNNELNSFDGTFKLVVVNSETINLTITFDKAKRLLLTLVKKLAGDYANPSSGTLAFSQLKSIEDNNIYGQANVGITGSYADNSLYIANRDVTNISSINKHTTRKLDIDSNDMITNIFEFEDFYTKRAFVINNELIVFGGNNIYNYDLDLSTEPTLVLHGLGGIGISRFGSATVNDDIYIIGGDLDELESDKIIKYNQVTGTISEVGLLPGPKTHAGAEIVDDKLYVFSGRQQFSDDDTIETISYIYDLNTGATSSFDVTLPMANTYASRYQNLIYVCGDVWTDIDGDGNPDDFKIEIGVYDTTTNVYTQLDHDLDDSDAYSVVAAMTVFNGKMYVIYGDASQPKDESNGVFQTWNILSTDLY